jgi:twitching motility protein PilT
VLVTGITGSGKSSTLSAMVSLINRTRREHIITIEDPIEFTFIDEKSLIEQIEVGTDVLNFETALRSAMRQDPDIVMIGEMRDRETVSTAIHCVETGHLVMSTLHTPDAKQTLMRLLHFFPIVDHDLVNEQMALNLRGVCCQRLIQTADRKGRLPVCEVLINTPIVTKLIREKRYDDLQQVLQNQEDEMQSFDWDLVRMVKEQKIALEDAMKYTLDQASFKRLLAGRSSGGDRRAIVG